MTLVLPIGHSDAGGNAVGLQLEAEADARAGADAALDTRVDALEAADVALDARIDDLEANPGTDPQVESNARLGADASGQSLAAALPRFAAAVTDYNDSTSGTLTVCSIGSSVGLGDTLTDAANDAPGAYLTAKLQGVVNKLGNVDLAHHNGCVGGHAFADGPTDLAAALAAASGTEVLVPIAFGMNDGTTNLYHNGQTLGGVRAFVVQLVTAIRAAGADPLLFTSPHPHTGRQTWGASLPIIYPASGQFIPDGTVGESIVDITLPSGDVVPCSYRHLRVNDVVRRCAAELGVTLIDAERCWFEALVTHDEDDLFNIGEIVHPNDLGHEVSYHAAIDQWAAALDTTKIAATVPAVPASIVTGEQFNVLVANPVAIRTLGDKEYGTLLVRAWHPGWAGNHAVRMFLVVGEPSVSPGGRVLSLGTLQGLGNNLVNVTVASGGVLTLTPTTDFVFLAWTYTRGYPFS